MKKFAFAAQVFGVFALFQAYVILEMNHGFAESQKSKIENSMKEDVEKPIMVSGSPFRISADSIYGNETSIGLAKPGFRSY
ncbi:MAG: hypothetical protein H7Y42_11755 [Chitinophagaceae bacterium]|nr:hypothetical protein [Chitinophagaceae bacterium]